MIEKSSCMYYHYIVPNIGIFLTIILTISCINKNVSAQAIIAKSMISEEVSNYLITAPKSIKPDSVILLAGDSLAVGMEGRFRQLAKLNNYIPAVHAVNGTSIFQWNNWIKKDLERYKPRLVIVSLGTNDAVIYDKLRQNPSEYKKFADIVMRTGAKLVWIGPPNISKDRIPKIWDTRTLIKSSVPIFFESERYETPSGGDGIHSSMNGYNKWIEVFWAWMIQENIIFNSNSVKEQL